MDVREKLVELIKDGIRKGLRAKGDNRIDYSFEDVADHLISNGVTVQEWIPVTERLPEEWTDVLVFSRFGFIETAVYTGAHGKWRVGWNGDMLEADSITHWMPLPEPPKGVIDDAKAD